MPRNVRFGQTISVGPHVLQADKPSESGGNDAGPNPHKGDHTMVGFCVPPFSQRKFLMRNVRGLAMGVILALLAGGLVLLVTSAAGENPTAQPPLRPRDAIADAQTPKEVPAERPEQKKTAHDLSDIFTPSKAAPSSEALIDQPEHGGMNGFDFYRDPLGAMKPGTTFEEVYKAAVANKPKVTWRGSESCWRAATTSSPGSTRRPRCRGASPSWWGRRPACRRGWTGRRWPP